MNEQINWDRALASVNGDRNLLRIVIDAFLQESMQLQDQISEAIANNDAELLHRSGHTLKGGMMSLGADAWSPVALRIEELGASDTTDGAQELSDQLKAGLPGLLEQLRSFSP